MATNRNRLDILLDHFALLQRQYGRYQHMLDNVSDQGVCNGQLDYLKDKLAKVKRKLRKARADLQLYVKGQRAGAFIEGGRA